MKRRPTIPVFESKLSIDLEETRLIQNQEGTPAFKCECGLCKLWKSIYSQVIPETLLTQLNRVGIDVIHPTELYESNPSEKDIECRITFHAVGKILSGPEPTVFNTQINDNVMNYLTVREQPYFSLIILPERQSYEATPKLSSPATGEIICLDMRFIIPKDMTTS